MADTVLRTRNLETSTINPDGQGSPLVLGTIGFLTYATTANPTAEALSSTTDAVAGHVFSENAVGVTLSLTAGTLAAPRDGIFECTLQLTNVTAASNSGVISFSIQKNAAALTNAKTIGWTNAAAILPGLAGSNTARISLVKGDLIRAVVTGTTGGILTIGNGSLSIMMLSDATIPSQV